MFSANITRVAHRTQSVVTAAAATLTTSSASTAAHRASQCIAARRPHQRRHSSSKASCPPDSTPPSGKPAPAAKAASSASAVKSPTSDEIAHQRGSKRTTKSKRQRGIGSEKPEDKFAGLPSVPNTQIHRHDLRISNFYSLGRPLSLTSPIPPVATKEAFESIFELPPQQHDPWENGNSAERRPEDVIYTLHNTIDTLEGSVSNPHDDNVRWEIIADEPHADEGHVKHLDGLPPVRTLDEIVAQFKPYRVPPPPQAFPEDQQPSAPQAKTASKKSAWKAKQTKPRAAQPEQKSYSTTIVVTESTGVNGQRTFFAQSTPMVRIPTPVAGEGDASTPTSHPRAAHSSTPSLHSRWQFRERMQQRQHASLRQRPATMIDRPSTTLHRSSIRQAPQARRATIHAISVRRQRKLKMKKHKLKKLMRRTRTLRRRQDRA